MENEIGMKKLSLPSSPDSLVNSEDATLCELRGEHIWCKWILCSLQCDKTRHISSRYTLLRFLLSCLIAGSPVAIWYTQSVILNVTCHLT